MESKKSRILVVGLGNPALGDDGVGWKIAAAVQSHLSPDQPVDVVCLSLGGVSLMERLMGYGCAILIDAFALEEPLGSILMLKLGDLPHYSAFHTASARDISLQTAIQMGKAVGAHLPDDVTVVGIATKRPHAFSGELSAAVSAAVPQAVKFVLDLVREKTRVYDHAPAATRLS